MAGDMQPTASQIRAARALAKWGQADLASHANLSAQTIKHLEDDKGSPKQETIARVVTAFRHIGIEFTDNDGVRRMPSGIEVFEGRDGFADFMNYMYEYLGQFGGEVCVYIQNESLLSGASKNIKEHRGKMSKMVADGKVTGRILAAKGNDKSTWAQVRRIPVDDSLPQVSFQTFGDNIAMISFDTPKPPHIVLHKSGPFAAVYKKMFYVLWEKAQ